MVKKAFFIFCFLFAGFFSATAMAWTQPLPQEYGRVIIDNYSQKAGLAPVVFDHWLHRALHTCRLCHVDIGFAMQKKATKIKAITNRQGYYCGACHNGRMVYNDKTIFESCSEKSENQDMKKCERCHSMGKNVKMEYDFSTFTKNFPRANFGNKIDWEKAEDEGKVKPVDYLEGISMKRTALKPQDDFSIKSKLGWMTNVLFSHKKHAIWNGCEVCHPEIFPSTKKGTVKYNMLEITWGKYCGVCHDKVAFPIVDCDKCHTGSVK